MGDVPPESIQSKVIVKTYCPQAHLFIITKCVLGRALSLTIRGPFLDVFSVVLVVTYSTSDSPIIYIQLKFFLKRQCL